MPVIEPLGVFTATAVVTPTNSATQLPSAATSCRVVTVQADPANSGTIYLGSSASLTSAPALAHTALQAGDWRVFEINNPNMLWQVCATASQKLLVGFAA